MLQIETRVLEGFELPEKGLGEYQQQEEAIRL